MTATVSTLTGKRLSPPETTAASAPVQSEPLVEQEPETEPEEPPEAPAGEEPPAQKLERRGRPEELRAVCLTPDVDYSTKGSGEDVRSSIAGALENAKSLTMNTIVAKLYSSDGAIYTTSSVPCVNGETDILDILIDEAHAQDFYVYVLYDASADAAGTPAGRIDLQTIEFAAANAGELAARYAVDGVMIDSYENETQADSYAQYIQSNAAIGFEQYMRSHSEALYRAVYDAMAAQEDLEVGIVAGGVWENASRDASGSNTSADRTLLHDGNADVRRWLADGHADFVVFLPEGATDNGKQPYRETLGWWARIAQEDGLPLYVLHRSDLVCTDAPGYASPDELAQQVIYAREAEGYSGSAYSDLGRLVENPQSSTDLLIRLYQGEVNVQQVLTRLAVTNPEQAVFSTFEPVMSFRGASDPNFEVRLDGETIETDENGYFTVTKDLEAGENSFTFEHKGKTQSFTITRVLQIVKEVSPTENVELEGGMRLQISALAYSDATVTASINGASVTLERDDTIDDSTDAGSAYSRFTGAYTVPAATGSKQSLGTISVTGTWQGITDTKQGASVSVNPIVAAGDGDLVMITADSAKTFPNSVLNNESDPTCFPLPKGTKDYAVSETLTFKNASGTYHYVKLQSGLRVYAEDVTKVDGDLALGNAISSMKITSDKQYTYVRLKMRDPVPHLVSYSANGISFDFQYTSSVPDSQKVRDNPVISSADWSGTTLTLRFTRSGSFLGYYGYYEDDTLVLRLTNPPLSLSGVRIAIDPGHGGKDKGAPGYFPDVSEAEVNAAIAAKTAEALRSAGASVKLIQTDPYLTLTQRLDEARAYDASIYISIHANSSESRPDATGTEVFYFYPNGQPLASAVAGRVANALDTSNRGAKDAQYVVTSDVRFTSILIETGFISSKSEYKKLTNSSYQSKVAQAIADGVASYIGAVSTGISGGNDSTEGEEEEEPEEEEMPPEDERESGITALELDKEDITLAIGETYRFSVLLEPENADDSALAWSTDDESVAVISQSGRVEAVGAGKAVITVSDGEQSASCIVRVKE